MALPTLVRSAPRETMSAARSLAVSLVLAVTPFSAAHAVGQPPVVMSCDAVAPFVATWTVAGEPLTRLVIRGTVTALAAQGTAAFTMLCGGPDLPVVCVEQSSAGLAPGDPVTVEGVVARADGTQLVLDPCGALLQR